MKTALILAGLLALVALPIPVSAELDPDCFTDSAAIPVGQDANTYYVDAAGPSIYKENNGEAGLQHGGENSDIGGLILGPDLYPACSTPDEIVF
jgi:hypothetical protein